MLHTLLLDGMCILADLLVDLDAACRNSKLTMLLQDSLGGDAKALMFCNVASTATHATETLSSLGFASKVSSVVLKTPQRKFQEAKEHMPAGRSAQRK